MRNRKSFALRATAVTVLALFGLSSTAWATSETKEIFRRYNGKDHLPTANPNEGNQYGYYTESSLLFYSTPYGGSGGTPAPTVAIYRCLVNGWDHMLSPDPNCEGRTREGLMGYLLTGSRSGHVAIYRCRNDQQKGDHFWSTDPNCEGRVTEFRLGYGRLSNKQYNRTDLNSGAVNNDCLGRCGNGCSWMPWEAWTSACRRHDECVRDNGHLHCLDGRFLDAAISYVVAGVKSLIKSIGNAIKSFFDWF